MLKLLDSLMPRLVLLIFSCCLLSACASRIAAMTQTTRAVFQGEPDPSAGAVLNPSIRYLRVKISGRVILLALGYVDTHPLGPVEVWYSANGEVLRLQNGHVVGLTGSDSEWRQVRLSGMPAWPADASSTSSYTRVRDVMPGYRFGILDRLQIRQIDAPARSNLAAVPAQSLRWFEELDANNALPAARFAISTSGSAATVVYGEQCISHALCLSWQQWPPVRPTP
jgi:hypothetical protein